MKKEINIKGIIIIIFIVLNLNAFTQNDTIMRSNYDIVIPDEESIDPELVPGPIDSIYIYVEHMPEYPEGPLALRRFIAENLVYPAISHNGCGIQGSVYLRFEVTKTGEIGKIEIQRGIDPLLDEEALKVVKLLPKFKPGMHEGKAVNVWYSLPIKFALN